MIPGELWVPTEEPPCKDPVVAGGTGRGMLCAKNTARGNRCAQNANRRAAGGGGARERCLQVSWEGSRKETTAGQERGLLAECRGAGRKWPS